MQTETHQVTTGQSKDNKGLYTTRHWEQSKLPGLGAWLNNNESAQLTVPQLLKFYKYDNIKIPIIKYKKDIK